MDVKRGIALGNAIIAARTASAFFADDAVRIRWLNDFMNDVMGFEHTTDDVVETGSYKTLHRNFPNWNYALFEFCMGRLTVESFIIFATSSPILSLSQNKLLNNDLNAVHRKEIWENAVRRVAEYTNSTYSDTDLKVEFERVYELDAASSADTGYRVYDRTLAATESMKTILSFSFLNKAAVFANGTLEEWKPVRYKSYMYGSNLLLLDNDLANYEVPGSDDFRSLHRHIQRVLDMNAAEMERFIYNIVTITGGYVVNCPRYGGSNKRKVANKQVVLNKRRQVDQDNNRVTCEANNQWETQVTTPSPPPPTGCVQFTSFNRINNSIQFTFNTHNRRYYYTANVLTLPADDFCTNDFVLKRSFVSSVCRCARPTLAWRVCVLITPINTASVVDGSAKLEVERVLMAALKSFRSVYEDKLSRLKKGCSRVTVMSGFLGLPIASYLDKITSPKAWRSKTDTDVASPELLCGFHSWLRAYCAGEWTVYSGKNALLRLLYENSGRAVIVRRPVIMAGADSESVGWRAFVRYMTYEDTIEKVLRLTEYRFYKGSEATGVETSCGVAYTRGTDDLIVFKNAKGKSLYRNDDKETMVREQKRLSSPNAMWNASFHAPSRIIVDVEVLLAIGFNPVELAISYTGGGRTFEHEDPITGDRCTVFCSSLLRLVTKTAKMYFDNYNEDEKYGILMEETDLLGKGAAIDPTGYNSKTENDAKLQTSGVRVLYNDKPQLDSRLEINRPSRTDARERYREYIHNITAYWSGVYMVTIDFVDPGLEYVKFAFFTGNVNNQMTLKDLFKFSDHCTENNVLPPPILNTIQSVVLKHQYVR